MARTRTSGVNSTRRTEKPNPPPTKQRTEKPNPPKERTERLSTLSPTRAPTAPTPTDVSVVLRDFYNLCHSVEDVPDQVAQLRAAMPTEEETLLRKEIHTNIAKLGHARTRVAHGSFAMLDCYKSEMIDEIFLYGNFGRVIWSSPGFIEAFRQLGQLSQRRGVSMTYVIREIWAARARRLDPEGGGIKWRGVTRDPEFTKRDVAEVQASVERADMTLVGTGRRAVKMPNRAESKDPSQTPLPRREKSSKRKTPRARLVKLHIPALRPNERRETDTESDHETDDETDDERDSERDSSERSNERCSDEDDTREDIELPRRGRQRSASNQQSEPSRALSVESMDFTDLGGELSFDPFNADLSPFGLPTPSPHLPYPPRRLSRPPSFPETRAVDKNTTPSCSSLPQTLITAATAPLSTKSLPAPKLTSGPPTTTLGMARALKRRRCGETESRMLSSLTPADCAQILAALRPPCAETETHDAADGSITAILIREADRKSVAIFQSREPDDGAAAAWCLTILCSSTSPAIIPPDQVELAPGMEASGMDAPKHFLVDTGIMNQEAADALTITHNSWSHTQDETGSSVIAVLGIAFTHMYGMPLVRSYEAYPLLKDLFLATRRALENEHVSDWSPQRAQDLVSDPVPEEGEEAMFTPSSWTPLAVLESCLAIHRHRQQKQKAQLSLLTSCISLADDITAMLRQNMDDIDGQLDSPPGNDAFAKGLQQTINAATTAAAAEPLKRMLADHEEGRNRVHQALEGRRSLLKEVNLIISARSSEFRQMSKKIEDRCARDGKELSCKLTAALEEFGEGRLSE